MNVRRNDPCPCGSGTKYKRCCLERETQLVRLVGKLEGLVGELGALAADRWPERYEVDFHEFYGGDRFGTAGPSKEERLEAELWIVCDRDLGAGESPLASEQRHPGEPAADLEMLSASRIRAWHIEELLSGGSIAARCPLTAETAILETVRTPAGEPAPGRMLVARSVSLGEGRFALLGRCPVVEPAVQDEFDDLLAQLTAESRDEGGRLLSAAWRWPEERRYTFEGTVARHTTASWDLRDLDAGIETLSREAAFELTDRDERDEPDVESWHWVASVGERAAEPRAEPGVRWSLCEDDAAEPRYVALVEIDPFDGRLWLHAPSAERLERVEGEVRRILGDLIGEPFWHDSDRPDSSFRWQRERWERTLPQVVAA